MAYRVTVVDGASFMPVYDLPLDTMPWKRAWNTGHQGSLSFKVSAAEDAPELERTRIWPLEYWLVVQWNNTPVYAAIITDHKYNWKSRTVTVSYADIWWFWDRRHVLGNRSSDAGTYSMDWNNISYRTLAKRAVEYGIAGPGPLVWDLPIVLPSETSGTLDRTVQGYQFETVKEVLDEAADAGGLDIDFRPRWASDGSLQWVMEFSSDGSFLYYDMDAAEHPVLDLDYQVVGSRFANHVYARGEGSEVDMLVRQSSKPTATLYPALERVIDGKSVDKAERLQALVTAERTSHDAMIRQTSLKVHADGPPHVGEFRLGAKVHWRHANDPYLPTIWHEQTLIEFSGSLDKEVDLVMTDWGG